MGVGPGKIALTAFSASPGAAGGLSVPARRSVSDRPVVIEQVRAAACILAFTNALAVSLFGLVPGNNIGYPAVVFAVVGILFTAAGTRSIFSGHVPRHHVPRQLALIALLLATFTFELAVRHRSHPPSGQRQRRRTGQQPAGRIADHRDRAGLGTRRRQGHGHHFLNHGAHRPRPQPRQPPSSIPAPRSGRDRTRRRPRTAGTHRGRRPPAVNSTSPARGSGWRRSSRSAKRSDGAAVLRAAVTRGCTGSPAPTTPRAAQARGLAPGHLRRPAGPAHVGDHDRLAVTESPHRSPVMNVVSHEPTRGQDDTERRLLVVSRRAGLMT